MLNKREYKRKGLSWGFTLVETLLAIALLSASIILPLSIGSSSLTAATTGKDRLTALSLARDAVEFVRFVRDTNRLQDMAWLSGLENCIAGDGTGTDVCRVDTRFSDNIGSSVLAGNSSLPLRYFSNTGIYGYENAWPVTKFKREVSIVGIDNPSNPVREARVTATVTWNSQFNTKQVKVTDFITNWEIP